jgi:hypothetical protein
VPDNNGWDAQQFTNVSASTAAFRLSGGRYQVSAVATWGGGNVHLQTLAADGSTWLDVGSSTNFTANGLVVVDLSSGQYRFSVTTATAVYVSISAMGAP